MAFSFDELKFARDRGYSDDEIWNIISSENKEIGLAKQRGYSLDEVASIESGKPMPSVEAPEPETIEERGIVRAAGDVGVAFTQGGVRGFRSLTDVFGADNPASTALRGVEDYVGNLLSAQAKKDQGEVSRILTEAQDKGIYDQLIAGVEAFATAPVLTTAGAAGSIAVNLLGGITANAASLGIRGIALGARGMMASQAAIGAAQGAGIIKGEIYDATESYLLEQGMSPEIAKKGASEAQSYGGKNLDSILLGAGLGAAAARFGVEKVATNVILRQGGIPTTKAITRFVTGTLEEMVPEAAQAGQEQLAKNLALQREGADVPTMRGVVGSAAMEGLAGGALGGPTSLLFDKPRGDTPIIKPKGKTPQIIEEEEIDSTSDQVADELEKEPVSPATEMAMKRMQFQSQIDNLTTEIEEDELLLQTIEQTSPDRQKAELALSGKKTALANIISEFNTIPKEELSETITPAAATATPTDTKETSIAKIDELNTEFDALDENDQVGIDRVNKAIAVEQNKLAGFTAIEQGIDPQGTTPTREMGLPPSGRRSEFGTFFPDRPVLQAFVKATDKALGAIQATGKRAQKLKNAIRTGITSNAGFLAGTNTEVISSEEYGKLTGGKQVAADTGTYRATFFNGKKYLVVPDVNQLAGISIEGEQRAASRDAGLDQESRAAAKKLEEEMIHLSMFQGIQDEYKNIKKPKFSEQEYIVKRISDIAKEVKRTNPNALPGVSNAYLNDKTKLLDDMTFSQEFMRMVIQRVRTGQITEDLNAIRKAEQEAFSDQDKGLITAWKNSILNALQFARNSIARYLGKGTSTKEVKRMEDAINNILDEYGIVKGEANYEFKDYSAAEPKGKLKAEPTETPLTLPKIDDQKKIKLISEILSINELAKKVTQNEKTKAEDIISELTGIGRNNIEYVRAGESKVFRNKATGEYIKLITPSKSKIDDFKRQIDFLKENAGNYAILPNIQPLILDQEGGGAFLLIQKPVGIEGSQITSIDGRSIDEDKKDRELQEELFNQSILGGAAQNNGILRVETDFSLKNLGLVVGNDGMVRAYGFDFDGVTKEEFDKYYKDAAEIVKNAKPMKGVPLSDFSKAAQEVILSGQTESIKQAFVAETPAVTEAPAAEVAAVTPTKEVRNIEEASQETGVPQEAILSAAQNGEIEAAKVGNNWRFGQKGIDEIKSKLSETITPTEEATGKPAKFPTMPSIEEQTAEKVYGGETGLYDPFAGVQKKRTKAEDPAGRRGTEDQIKNADEHAAEIGGTVLYQDGDISLIRGYSLLGGNPVYIVANKGSRARTDISSYTGNLVAPEQKAQLVDIKNKIEAEDQASFNSKPFITFTDGIAFSNGVPSTIAGVLMGWKSLLNIKANLYITTYDDAVADKDNFNGPHRVIGSAGLASSKTDGSIRKMPNGDFYIMFRGIPSRTKMLETLAHELGHLHQKEAFENADLETKQMLREEHDKWVKSQTGKTAQELISSLRAVKTAKTNLGAAEGIMAEEMSAYWKSFGEWYADQVSRWAVSAEKPLTIVDKFFSRIAKALRSFYANLTNRGYLPNETFVKYLEKTLKEPARIVSETITPAIEAKAGVSPKMDTDYLAAVERGDMETAQRMANEASQANMPYEVYNSKTGEVVWSGTYSQRDTARQVRDRRDIKYGANIFRTRFTKIDSSVKVVDPVTYDESGNVIPLSQRFDVTSPIIARAGVTPEGEPMSKRGQSIMQKITTRMIADLEAQAEMLKPKKNKAYTEYKSRTTKKGKTYNQALISPFSLAANLFTSNSFTEANNALNKIIRGNPDADFFDIAQGLAGTDAAEAQRRYGIDQNERFVLMDMIYSLLPAFRKEVDDSDMKATARDSFRLEALNVEAKLAQNIALAAQSGGQIVGYARVLRKLVGAGMAILTYKRGIIDSMGSLAKATNASFNDVANAIRGDRRKSMDKVFNTKEVFKKAVSMIKMAQRNPEKVRQAIRAEVSKKQNLKTTDILLQFASGLFDTKEDKYANMVLDQTVQNILSIGMNKKEFSIDNVTKFMYQSFATAAKQLGVEQAGVEKPKRGKRSGKYMEMVKAVIGNDNAYKSFLNDLASRMAEKYQSKDAFNADFAELFTALRSNEWADGLREQAIKDTTQFLNYKFADLFTYLGSQRNVNQEAVKQHIRAELQGTGASNELIEKFIQDTDKYLNEETSRILQDKLGFRIDEKTGKVIPKPLLSSKIKEEAEEQFKAIKNLKDISKLSTSDEGNFIEALISRIITEVGMDKEQATELATLISTQMEKAMLAQRSENVDRAIKDAQVILNSNGIKPKTNQRTVLQKLIEMANMGVLDAEGVYEAFRKTHDFPKGFLPYDADFTNTLREWGDRISKLPPGVIRSIEEEKMGRALMEKSKFTTGDILSSYWYFSLLSQVATPGINVLSGASNLMANVAVWSLYNPKSFFPMMRAMYHAIDGRKSPAVNSFLYVMRNGLNPSGMQDEKRAKYPKTNVLESATPENTPKIVYYLTNFGDGKINFLPDWMNTALKNVNPRQLMRVLRATDMFLREVAYEAKAAQIGAADFSREGFDMAKRQAESELFSSDATGKQKEQEIIIRANEIYREQRLDETGRAIAEQASLETAFNQQPVGLFGLLANFVNSLLGKYAATKFIIPFTDVVANVTNEFINYTPFFSQIRLIGSKRRGVNDPFTQGSAEKQMEMQIKGFIGLAAMAVPFIIQALTGGDDEDQEERPYIQFYAEGPKDPRQKKIWQQRGGQKYSVRVGNTYFSYLPTPLVIPLAMGAMLQEEIKSMNKKGKKVQSEDIGKLAASVLTAPFSVGFVAVLNQSFLTGLADLLEFKESQNPVEKGTQVVGGILSRMAVPGVFRDINKLYTEDKAIGGDYLSNFLKDFPGSVNFLNKDVNYFGDDAKFPSAVREEGFGKRLASVVGRIVSTEQPDPAFEVMYRNNLTPPSWDASLSWDNGKRMTKEQELQFIREAGPLMRERIVEVSDELDELPIDEAQDLLSTEIRIIRREVKEDLQDRLEIPLDIE